MGTGTLGFRTCRCLVGPRQREWGRHLELECADKYAYRQSGQQQHAVQSRREFRGEMLSGKVDSHMPRDRNRQVSDLHTACKQNVGLEMTCFAVAARNHGAFVLPRAACVPFVKMNATIDNEDEHVDCGRQVPEHPDPTPDAPASHCFAFLLFRQDLQCVFPAIVAVFIAFFFRAEKRRCSVASVYWYCIQVLFTCIFCVSCVVVFVVVAAAKSRSKIQAAVTKQS